MEADSIRSISGVFLSAVSIGRFLVLTVKSNGAVPGFSLVRSRGVWPRPVGFSDVLSLI